MLIAGAVIAVVGMAGVAYVARADPGRRLHAATASSPARRRSRSCPSCAPTSRGARARWPHDLDGFDDGSHLATRRSRSRPTRRTRRRSSRPTHPLSGNVADRRASGAGTGGSRSGASRASSTRDLRICTVRVYRHRPGRRCPGDADGRGLVGRAHGRRRLPDDPGLRRLPAGAREHPGLVGLHGLHQAVHRRDAAATSRRATPASSSATHWITTSGYGRDEEYAPYTNETRISTDARPGPTSTRASMPARPAASRYYVPSASARG